KKLGAYLVWQKISGTSQAQAPADPANSAKFNPHGIGTGDPVEQVTRSWSGRYGQILSDWEADLDPTTPSSQTSTLATARGWVVGTPGSSLSLQPTVDQSNYTRFGSLMLSDSAPNATTDISLDRTANGAGQDGAGIINIAPGSLVTFRVFRASGASNTD